jgi:hypothetical protein
MVQDVAAACERRGGRFLWEVLDLRGVEGYVDFMKSRVDLWIVSNRLMAERFVELGGRRAVAVPHHHTNMLDINNLQQCRNDIKIVRTRCGVNCFVCCFNSKILQLGDTHSAGNEPPQSFVQTLQNGLNDRHIRYEVVRYREVLTLAGAIEANRWQQDALHDSLQHIDIALIWYVINLCVVVTNLFSF